MENVAERSPAGCGAAQGKMRHDYAIYRTEAEKTSSLALPTFQLGLFLGGIRLPAGGARPKG